MMERRGFLGSMFAAVAAKVLPDTLVFEPGPIKAVAPQGLEVVNLDLITKEIAREFETYYRKIAGRTVSTSKILRVGESIGPVTMTDQVWVDFAQLNSGENKDLRERFIRPAAQILANTCANKHINVFGSLTMPYGGAEATIYRPDSLILRGCMAYSTFSDSTRMRFDVVGGHA